MGSQLVFDLQASYPPSLENFVSGRNGECLAQLQRLVVSDDGDSAGAQFIYLWGQNGTGKSHLISAIEQRARSLGRPVQRGADPHDDKPASPNRLYLVDDVQLLDNEAQQQLFALYHQIKANPRQALLATGAQAPAMLTMRADLTSRLAWGLVYPLQLLSDDDKLVALNTLAAQRGISVGDGVFSYLLTRGSRDMRALTQLFDALDRFALARGRAISLPLLRDYLQQASP